MYLLGVMKLLNAWDVKKRRLRSGRGAERYAMARSRKTCSCAEMTVGVILVYCKDKIVDKLLRHLIKGDRLSLHSSDGKDLGSYSMSLRTGETWLYRA